MSAISGASAPSSVRQEMPWLIIVAGSLVAMLTFGPRSAMGFFQLPMLAETGWDRTTFGLAMALQNLCWGLSQPFFGAIADKFGTWRVLTMSGFSTPPACSSWPTPMRRSGCTSVAAS